MWFFSSSSLSTDRKQTVCTTDWTPTALSIHKVEMIFFFFASVFKGPPPPLLDLDAPVPAGRVEGVLAQWRVVGFDDGWRGGGGGVVLFPHMDNQLLKLQW